MNPENAQPDSHHPIHANDSKPKQARGHKHAHSQSTHHAPYNADPRSAGLARQPNPTKPHIPAPSAPKPTTQPRIHTRAANKNSHTKNVITPNRKRGIRHAFPCIRLTYDTRHVAKRCTNAPHKMQAVSATLSSVAWCVLERKNSVRRNHVVRQVSGGRRNKKPSRKYVAPVLLTVLTLPTPPPSRRGRFNQEAYLERRTRRLG